MFLDTYNILFAGLRFSPEFPFDRDPGEKQINDISVFYEPVRSAGSPGRFTGKSLSPDILPNYMNLSCQNPAFVIVILWGIAIFTTTFLFTGSANLTSGIVIQGVCMIGSAVYLRKIGETCRTRKQEI